MPLITRGSPLSLSAVPLSPLSSRPSLFLSRRQPRRQAADPALDRVAGPPTPPSTASPGRLPRLGRAAGPPASRRARRRVAGHLASERRRGIRLLLASERRRGIQLPLTSARRRGIRLPLASARRHGLRLRPPRPPPLRPSDPAAAGLVASPSPGSGSRRACGLSEPRIRRLPPGVHRAASRV